MRVKAGGNWHEPSAGSPLQVELTDADRTNIANMVEGATLYAIFDSAEPMSADEKRAWMSQGREDVSFTERERRAGALRAALQAADPEGYAPDGSVDGLKLVVRMLDTHIPDALPANEAGQVPFARCLAQSAADTVRAYLAALTPSPLLLAARAVMAVRPTNWDDPDDPHAVAAWTALQDALKHADPEDLGCGICALGFVQGDPCLTDVDLGPVHAACCGPERESYVDLATGEPLKDGQPIPTPWIWSGLFAAKPAALTPGVTVLRHHDGRTGSFVEIEADGRLRVQSLKGKGFWVFAPHQCDRVEAQGDAAHG